MLFPCAMRRPSPTSTLFPYTTLFRSAEGDLGGAGRDDGGLVAEREDQHLGLVLRGDLPCPVVAEELGAVRRRRDIDRKSTRLNSSHVEISYAVFCLKKNKPLVYVGGL